MPENESGKWRVEHFEVKRNVETFRAAMIGRPIPEGTYTRLMHGDTVVMSDTPAEVRDCYGVFIELRKPEVKRVLIHGLGLGMVLQFALSQKHVKHVDVVELSSDVLALVGPSYQDKRVNFINADCLRYQWPKGSRWDVVWHDIWNNMPNSDDLPTIAKLKRSFGQRTKWQGVWCEYEAHHPRW